jgi:cytochrome P450
MAARYNPDEPTKISDDITVPAGMAILTPMAVVLLDQNIWDDASVFNPNRFNQPAAKRPLYFSPFGFGGGRICPGRSTTYA